MKILSIDPGKRIGWALFDGMGEEIGRGVMDFKQFAHSLHYKPRQSAETLSFMARGALDEGPHEVTHVVFEAYYLDPGTKQGGSTGPAQEVIGVLKYLCLQAGIEWGEQRSAILPVAKVHHGYVQRVQHLPDQDSAWLHGMYYMVDQGWIPVPHDVSATL